MKPNYLLILLILASAVFMFFIYSSMVYNMQIFPTFSFINYCMPINEFMKGPLLQNDSRIIKYILDNNFLLPPPTGDNLPYNLTNPRNDPSMGQSQVVKKIFENMTGGFFIECGALDGEIRSNTLSLERDLGWKGLLVEGDPKNYEIVRTKNRKAWTAGCCLAVQPYPHEVIYIQEFNTGRIGSIDGTSETTTSKNFKSKSKSTVKVQCFPVFSLLSALGLTTVDYFSLDVEGYELGVLGTIPFDSVYIKVLSVEFAHVEGGEEALIAFMTSKGYRPITKITHKFSLANDVIFAHPDFYFNATFPEEIDGKEVSHEIN